MKKGLTSNDLKIVAIITMLIDHMGYYLYSYINLETYIAFRIIGRISMPIFTFLIVQGFLYTKNLKKYISRILGLALITQICFGILHYINITYFPYYRNEVYRIVNILFSYGLSLILLYVLSQKKIIKKYNDIINIFIKIIIILLILIAYLNFEFDYGLRIPFIMIGLYFIEKLCPKDTLANKLKYLSLILVVFLLSLIKVENGIICKYAMLLSLIFIAFYNGKKGNTNNFIKYSFYAFFPIHHTILYLIGMMS